jgi:uncharacterized protein (TIGR02145 family)
MKGLLLPRVALSAVNLASPLSAHVAGMMVYNTATAGTAPYNVTPGIYYNNGINWERVVWNSSPAVTTLSCGTATSNPTSVYATVAYSGTATVPYTGGNGVTYGAGSGISSTGVTGLTATLQAGTLATGSGNLTYSISGTPSSTGTATFALSFGGQSCNLTLTVTAAPAVTALSCGTATSNPTSVYATVAYSGTATVPYTGGNGASYVAGTGISSTGVTGLTATLQAGTLATGSGNLSYSISGTPSSTGTATFALSFGGQSCNLTLTVTAAPAVTALSCGTATSNPTSVYATVAYSGTATVPYTGGNGVTYGAGTGISSTGVTGLTATLQAGTLATGSGNLTYNISGTPSSTGTATFALSFGGQSCNLTLTVSTLSGIVPANITLAQNQSYFIASIYDQNYLPYTTPSGAASTTRPSNPDGTNESVTINVQGSLTTTGINVSIPVTTTGSGTLAAYNGTINIPSSLTEDGISRYVTLSWASQSYTSSTKTIVANIKSVGGTLNALKLDINAGVGNTALGILLGQIPYPYNNAGATSNYNLRDIAGIPDKMFGLADNNSNTTTHMMLYQPVVAEDGNVWLNNNLGAHYSNINHSSFNFTSQATSETDYKAYGSLFQWGRKPDGHELITFTSSSAGTAVNDTTTTIANAPTHTKFIINTTTSPFDWRTTQDSTLWANVGSANNPCPDGFRVPTEAELTTLISNASITNSSTAASSKLKFTVSGWRHGPTGQIILWASQGYYWTSSTVISNARYLVLSNSSEWFYNANRPYGYAMRCIKN